MTDPLMGLADIRSCWSPTMSPAGDFIAFISDEHGDARAYVTPTSTWKPAPIALEDLIAASVAWSRSEEPSKLLVAASPPGSLQTVLCTVDPDGDNLRRVDGPPGGTAFGGCWAPGGPCYAFTAVGPDATEAVLLNVVTGARRTIAEGGGLVVADVSADGRLALLRSGPRGRRHLMVADDQGTLVRTLPRDNSGVSENGRFLNSGSALWILSNAGREFFALLQIPLDRDEDGSVRAGAATTVTGRDDADLEWWRLSADEQQAVLVWNVGGVSEIEVLTVASGLRRPVPGLATGVVGGLDVSDDGARAVIEWSSPTQPRSLWTFDISDGTPTAAVPFSEIPLPGAAFDAPSSVSFPAHDGVMLSGWLYRPAQTAGPVVISLHGGPEAQARPDYSPLAQALVAQGIGVFMPNVRGSSGAGRTFVELDSGLRRLDAVRDVATCATWLVDEGIADAGRLGVHGVSYGGYLVLAAIVAEPDLFAAAASVCGISDFLTFFAGTEPWIAAAARTKYGDPAVDVALLRELSPLQRLPSAHTPTLLVHGIEDTNVPIGEARAAHAALTAGGVRSRLVELPGEGHSMLRPESRLIELRSIIDWFAAL